MMMSKKEVMIVTGAGQIPWRLQEEWAMARRL